QVDGVLLERLAALFRVRIGDLLTAAYLVNGLLNGPAHHAGLLEELAEGAVLEGREHEQLAGNGLDTALLHELVDDVKYAVQIGGDVPLAGVALDLGQPFEQGEEPRAQLVDVGP